MKPIYQAGPWITRHEIRTVVDMMRTGWYEHPYDFVEKFQNEFAQYHGRKYGIMTPNCTTAIHLLLTALGIKEGDEVIVPECTWIATAAPITYLRATPVFCDIDPIHWCLDPESVRKRISRRTKAIIMVDLFGNMPRIDELVRIAKERRLWLIEDAAEALGSIYRKKKAGSFGIGSVFSFHRTKTLVTGEGGMLVLDNASLYKKCLLLRDHGRKPGGAMYYNYAVTYKYMPFNLQAALGYAQFQRIDELCFKKRWMLSEYRNGLKDIPDIQLNEEPPEGLNGAWITTLVFGKRYQMTKTQAISRLAKLHIPSRPFFYPLSMLPAYKAFKKKYRNKNPVAYDISRRGINLPCSFRLTKEQIRYICRGIHTLLNDIK